MPSKRHRPSSDSSSDSDDAPETFSLTESKQSARRKNEEIEKAHAAIKKQSKLKNQERDWVLKEQAKKRKEREREDETPDALEVRMERAMKEAQEEAADSEGDERDGSAGLEMLRGSASDMDAEDREMDYDEDGSDMTDDEVLTKKPPKHLPDHLFEAAFASQKAQPSETSKPTTKNSKKKKRKTKTKSKDIILGSRTIRTLSSTLQASKEGSYAPMRKAQKYVERSLALKGGNSRVRGWQRRPANVGVMRQSGPAASFVRS